MKVFPADPEPGEYRFVNVPRVGRRLAYVLSITRSFGVVVTHAIASESVAVRWSKPSVEFFVDVVKDERPSPHEIESVVKVIGSPLANLKKVYVQ